MEITASEFISTWKAFMTFKTQTPDWKDHWNSNTDWSNFILGGKKSSNKTSPIGQFFQNKYGEQNLGFRSEDGLVDLTLFDKSDALEFELLDKNWKPEKIRRPDYPCHYQVLIEHENNIYTAWEEIAKLTYYRARLKVLITYISDDLPIDKRNLEIKMMESSLKDVISKSNRIFPEHTSTEYLLIIGAKDRDQLVWNYRTFDTKGDIIPE
ncbi:MAG: hypothetical protein KI791_10005 [Cyclobacteriaceae bacterium]|nr:hypothetical protein [Cyclobacteriaceae bacterium SS2]